jgi:hypothetical protein
MDEQEQEELLYKLDERMERIENEHLRRLREIDKQVTQNSKDIDDLQANVKRNTTIIGGIGTTATAFVLWVADKLSRFL